MIGTTRFWRSRHTRRRPGAFLVALVVYIIVILVAAPEAQQPQTFAPAASSATGIDPSTASPMDIDLLVGRSTVLNVGMPVSRISLTVPDIADAMVTAPSQLLIHGKQPGTISLFVWDKSGGIKTFEVTVRRDLSSLVDYLKQLFPGEPITVIGSGKDVVISGTVSSKYVIEKAADVASGYVEKKENVVNLLKQQEGVASNQVMLRVRFAEVSRSALQELGASLFTGPGGFHDYVARSTTQQFPSVNYDPLVRSSIQGPPDNWGGGRDTVDATGGKMTFSDLLNIFLFNNKYNVGTIIKALAEKGLFQSLAEPNLIATNGKEASFLAGGEYPYPVAQASSGGTTISIQFKEFGVRLSFTPTVLGGDLINLKVKPEVSALDFSNAILVEGFRIPALTTRRTDTEVELRDGQTFAIAGLMNNTVTDSMRKIPGIGDIPILGWLFKSKAMQKNQTELVVMITPTIVKKGSMGVSEGLPNPVEPYLDRPSKVVPNPDAYTGSPRYPVTKPADKPKEPAPAPSTDSKSQAPKPAKTTPASQPSSVPSKPVTSKSTPLPNGPSMNPAPSASTPANTFTPNSPAMPGTFTPNSPASAPAPGPMTPAQMPQAQTPATQKPAGTQVKPAAQTPDQSKLVSKAQEQEKRAAEAEARERAAADKQKAEQDAAARRQADKLAKERAARDAEIAKRNAKDAEQSQKREKALAEAAMRLKQAQEAYESELQKAKSGTTDKVEKKDPSGSPAPMPMPPMPQTSKQ
jgi:pilus assembly protein CpaC